MGVLLAVVATVGLMVGAVLGARLTRSPGNSPTTDAAIALWVRIAFSLVASTLAAVHIGWPSVNIDAIVVGLLLAAAVPWLSPLFDSVELPGGWKINYRTFANASEVFDEIGEPTEQPSYLAVQELSPELGLVGLRIEIESRLQTLAKLRNITARSGSLRRILTELRKADVIEPRFAGALDEILHAGNAAAHGAEVPPAGASFAFDVGPSVLAYLDEVIERESRPK